MFLDILQNSQSSSVAEPIFQKIASLRSVTLLKIDSGIYDFLWILQKF